MAANFFWNRRWRVPSCPDEKHFVLTSDGFLLALERYRGAGRSNPVILCHGLAANSRFMDLTERESLARYLRSRGHDVWNLSLRGAGESRAMSSWSPPRWTLEDIMHKDVPEVLRYVRTVTGKPKIHWIGHSLGGSVVIGYLETEDPSAIESLVGIACPIRFLHPLKGALRTAAALGNLQPVKRLFLTLNVELLSQMVLPISHFLPPFSEALLFHPGNIDKATRKQLLANTVSDVNGGVLDQLLLSIGEGELKSLSGGTSYFRDLGKIRTPTLLIGGEVDRVVAPESLQPVLERLASLKKQYRLFGPSHGTPRPYGHIDLVVGKHAPHEVFPSIAAWLDGFGGLKS